VGDRRWNLGGVPHTGTPGSPVWPVRHVAHVLGARVGSLPFGVVSEASSRQGQGLAGQHGYEDAVASVKVQVPVRVLGTAAVGHVGHLASSGEASRPRQRVGRYTYYIGQVGQLDHEGSSGSHVHETPYETCTGFASVDTSTKQDTALMVPRS